MADENRGFPASDYSGCGFLVYTGLYTQKQKKTIRETLIFSFENPDFLLPIKKSPLAY
jgi:hypothetical protein